ncbi:MAG: transporter substrate-binding domain-containing protein, partial [Legionella sp.]
SFLLRLLRHSASSGALGLIRYYPAEYWAASESAIDQFKLIGGKMSLGEGYGIITRPENIDLIYRINNALLKLENNGVYMQIYKKYLTE